MIMQINSTSFLVYAPKKTPLHITCHNKEDANKKEIDGFYFVTLDAPCKAIINNHVFHSGIKIEAEVRMKQNDLYLQLEDLISVEDYIEKDFIKLVEEEQQIGSKPLKIRDVKEKYHLKTLRKQGHLFGIGSTSLIGSIIIIIITVIIIRRCVMKRRTLNQEGIVKWYHKPTPEEERGAVNLVIKPNEYDEPATSTEETTGTSFQLRALAAGRKKF